jgi:Tripartite tricarboxylate transporter family receptor
MSGTEIVHVPYKGGTAAITDLIAGRVDLMFESLTSIAPHARQKAIRALGVSRRATTSLNSAAGPKGDRCNVYVGPRLSGWGEKGDLRSERINLPTGNASRPNRTAWSTVVWSN